MPALVMAQVHNVAYVVRQRMLQRLATVGRAAIHANPDIQIMARYVARMSPMAPLPKIAARLVVSHATAVTTNPAELVSRINVQMAQNNAREGFRRRVQAAYGRAVQNVRQIRSAVAEAALRVVQISIYMAIHAKIIVQQIVERMGMHVQSPMQRQHVQAALAFIPVMPTTVM